MTSWNSRFQLWLKRGENVKSFLKLHVSNLYMGVTDTEIDLKSTK